MGYVGSKVAQYHVVLFDAFFLRDDFHIADCSAETLAGECVVYLGWVPTWAVCDQVSVSLLKSGVANADTISYGEFKDSLTFNVMGTEDVSTMGIAAHTSRNANVTIPVTNWDMHLSG